MSEPSRRLGETTCRVSAGLLAGVLVVPVAFADPSAVERCRAAPGDAERIACLEAALEASAATAGTDDATPGQDDAGRDNGSESGDDRRIDGIGAEQVRARQRATETLEAARGLPVERYETVPYRRLQVELANGQVWRQIDGDTQRIRVDLERNRTVDIERSALGGYRLRLNELGRTIRVERIR